MVTRFTLVIAMGADALSALAEAQSCLVLARSAGNAPPSVVWLTLLPAPATFVCWDEIYGLYAAELAGSVDVALRIVAEVYPVEDRRIYPFSGTDFGTPISAPRIPRDCFDVYNLTQSAMTFGLLQDATVDGFVRRSAVNAANVAAKEKADFSAAATLFIWVQPADAAANAVPDVPADATVVVLDHKHPHMAFRFNAQASEFTSSVERNVMTRLLESAGAAPLPVPYHQQDNEQFCGPASAQMIVAPILHTLVHQGALKDAMNTLIGAEPICKLGTGPEAFEHGINRILSENNSKLEFYAYYRARQNEGTSLLVRTIARGTAGAALIWEGRHWVAVIGADTTPGNAEPEWLYINNPFPNVPDGCCPTGRPNGQTPCHSPTDGCGTGGQRGNTEHVPIAAWRNTLTDASVRCMAKSSPLFIVIGARGLAVKSTPEWDSDGDLEQPISEEQPAKVEQSGGEHPAVPIREAVAYAALLTAIQRFGLAGDAQDPRSEPRPRLVQHLDHPDEMYYILPVTWSDGSTLVGRVDANGGIYLGAQVRPAGAYRLAEPAEALRSFHEWFHPFDADGVHDEHHFEVSDTLAWRPCAASFSPYYPFSQVMDRGTLFAFVDVNGKVQSVTDVMDG